jgi:hypothetical protein
MNMRRKLLIGLLAFGTVAGFGSGFFSMAHGGCRSGQSRREAFERHVAAVCVDAARRADQREHSFHHHPGDRPPPPQQF